MPNLGDIATVLGHGFLGAAGPSGRASSASLLNNRRSALLEADKMRREEDVRLEEQRLAQGKLKYEVLSQALKSVENKADREKLTGWLEQTVIDYPELGLGPEDVQALALVPPEEKDPYSAQAKLTADFNEGRISADDYRAGMRKLNYIRPETPAVQIYNVPPGASSSGAANQGGMGIIEKAEEATGPMSSLKQAVSDYTGWLFEGQLFPETVEAKQSVKLFNKTAEEALVQNPRFPVGEQEFVRSMLVDPDVIFQDPDDARSRMLGLKSYLEARIAADDKSIMNNTVTEKRKGELINMNDKRRQILSMMGDEKATVAVEERAEARTFELAKKVADGSATDEELNEFMELQNGR